MKRNYTVNRFANWLKPALAVILTLFVLNASADEITWTGAIDTDGTNPANWDPNLGIVDNTLNIGLAANFTNNPVFDLEGEAETYIAGLNMDSGSVVVVDHTGARFQSNSTIYFFGHLTIKEGWFRTSKSLYHSDSNSVILVEGGKLDIKDYFLVGHDKQPGGGFLWISGDGEVSSKYGPDRFEGKNNAFPGRGEAIRITDNGKMYNPGNNVALYESAIAKGFIRSDEDHDPYVIFDLNSNQTTVRCRSKDEFFFVNNESQQLFEGDEIDTVFMVDNRALTTFTNQEWKYATTSGGPYQSFTTAQTEKILTGSLFPTAGTYYVVYQGDNNGTTVSSEELVFSVSSRMVTISPDVIQYLRVGQQGAMLTAETQQAATSYEWKVSSQQGGPYVSFDPAITVDEFIPELDSGNHFVICEAIVDGTTYSSPEVALLVAASDFISKEIAYTGAVSTDAADLLNYDPVTYPYDNVLYIPRTEEGKTPVLADEGSYTINFIGMEDSAEFIIRKSEDDTVFIYNDNYNLDGCITIESGVLYTSRSFMRMDSKNAGIILKNKAQYINTSGLGHIMGNHNAPEGGILTIQDDAYVYCTSIFRFTSDTTQSIITISENGILDLGGDKTGDVATWLAKKQLLAKEGFTIKYSYDESNDITRVVAKSDIAFNLVTLEDQYVGAGTTGTEITTINDENITSREWKYAMTSGGGYMSFDPAITSDSYTPAFDTAGVYYVVCEGSDGSETTVTDEIMINVVSIDVTPAADQVIEPFTSFATLSYTESMASDRKEWKLTSTSGSGYASFPVAQKGETCSAIMTTEGVYYIVLECVYGDNAIVSNEVKVTVTSSAALNNVSEPEFSLYPNPTNGSFQIQTKEAGAISVKAFDISGKLVMSHSDINTAQALSINEAGLYFIEVTQNNHRSVSTLVVK